MIPTSLSVPSESGRWLLPSYRGVAESKADPFQYPQSRVVGCYTSRLPLTRARKSLSVPSESGRWLLPGLARDEQASPATFSTLRVGSLVATAANAQGLGLVVPFQYPQSRVVGCYAEFRGLDLLIAALSVPSESGRWLLPY